MDTKSKKLEVDLRGFELGGFNFINSTPTHSGFKPLESFPEIDLDVKEEKIKNEVALDHGFHDRIFGKHWEMAMREGELELRIDLYEEVIKRLL